MKQKKFFLHVVLFTILAVTAVRTYGQDTIATTTAPLPDNEKGLSGNLLTGTGTRTTASNNFDVNFYRCEWEIDPTIRFIKGKVTAYFTVTSATDKLVFDLSNVLTVDSVYYRGSTLSFQQTANDALELQFPVPFKGGHKDSVSIFYNGIPRNPASFKPFVQSSHSGSPIIYTLSEPFGAKEWWPCKNGLDDKADSIDVYITNPAVYQASSNGVMVDELLQNNTRISHWKHRYPIASYLVAMAVTNYAVLKDTMMVGGKPMDLIDYAYPESVAYFNQQHAYTKYTLNLYAKLFGDYPFAKEKYGFTQFNAGGGMEHQTNTFVIGPTVQLIAHESAHQWFGDKITCASWEDIWLNEGFATYCEVLYNESIDKNLIYQMLRNYTASIISAPDGSVRVDDTTSASRIFNGRLSYYKGAYLLHMLRWKLGDTVFFNGLRRYLNDPLLKYNHAKTADLQRNLEEESKQTLSSYFQNWFSNQGYPMYALEWMQDSSNNIAAKINQATSHTSVSFFDMPVPVRFKNSTRDTIIVFNHTKNGQIFISNPRFKADTAIFDPLLWLLCTSTTKQVSCIANAGNDESFPAYNIKWTQNANNWIYADVNQINPAASIATDIPLYLHFATNGHDTTIVLKNIGSHYSTWINAGFKATSIFVTTSCLLSNNYTISSQPSNQITNEVKLYPVPVTANNLNLSLKSPSDKHLSVTIFNTAGQLMYQRKLDTPGKDELFFIPVNNLAKGIYVIRLESEAAIKISKSIIKIF